MDTWKSIGECGSVSSPRHNHKTLGVRKKDANCNLSKTYAYICNIYSLFNSIKKKGKMSHRILSTLARKAILRGIQMNTNKVRAKPYAITKLPIFYIVPFHERFCTMNLI
ncbi:unnamed protein product [Albugo candida]|uniref:Uncharacterized protein n=1 Tax=Albugo candida TaxID=65357 RepID=A0A024GQH5_9STRA|nr:unnamed protein product [Albugo candida]|eukprot:CCI49031.1 unnamed protein product [Albugo candida]